MNPFDRTEGHEIVDNAVSRGIDLRLIKTYSDARQLARRVAGPEQSQGVIDMIVDAIIDLSPTILPEIPKERKARKERAPDKTKSNALYGMF